MDPYLEGYAAYEAGADVEDNPYHIISDMDRFFQWEEGWIAAEDEHYE